MAKPKASPANTPLNPKPRSVPANVVPPVDLTPSKPARRFSMADVQPEFERVDRPFMNNDLLAATHEVFVIQNIIVVNTEYGERFLLFVRFPYGTTSFKPDREDPEKFPVDVPVQEAIIGLASNKVRLSIFKQMSDAYGYALTGGKEMQESDPFFLDSLGRAFVLVDSHDVIDYEAAA